MATHKNLTELFTAIADAIREKTGATGPIVADDFPDAILAIVTGPSVVPVTVNNIQDYFTVANSSYYFKGDGTVFTSNNGGAANSTAQTILTAKYDMTVSFAYSYSSEANYDKFTLKFGNVTVENAVSGSTTTKQYSGNINAGGTITFIYTKDGSQNTNDDKCTFRNMSVTGYF